VEVDSGRETNVADSVPGAQQVRTGRALAPGRVTAFDYRASRRGRGLRLSRFARLFGYGEEAGSEADTSAVHLHLISHLFSHPQYKGVRS